ncbi:hypothetical protein VaNZ11_015562 [Volvox africanus]|uniref:Uncharacterized protein n=1 Tax=Volvox africanus TaxID=51714 RepID=A0ABQ5SMB8_9CHLO|nr:hypothetical protein VaNZ11_015562 [Volvox africanus]
MAFAHWRLSDLYVKNGDKAAKDKPLPAPSAPPFSSDGKALERGHMRSEGRSVSPTSSRAAQRARMHEPEEGCPGLLIALESADDVACGNEPGPSRCPGIHPFRYLNLEMCPSFSEQQNKMAFLDRHYTLQRVHSAAEKRKSGLCEVSSLHSVSERNDEAESGSFCDDILPGPSDTEFLLGWDLTKSKMWLVVGLLLKAARLSALPADADAYTNGRNPSALERVVEEEDSPDSTVEPPDVVAACETASRPRGALDRWRSVMRRARNMSPSVFSTPLGMGFTRNPSMSTLQSNRSFSGRLGRRSSIGPASSPAPLPCGGLDRHHVAYAAGLAAATSAAAAISHAATVAAAGVSISAGPTSASAALELGTKALGNCGGLLVEKVQGVAARHATAAVAEMVLGPQSCEVTRADLVKWVQATVAGASVMFFIGNLAAMSDALMHLDFEHNFTGSAKVVLDLVTSGSGFVENCKDLMCISVAIGVEVAGGSNTTGFEN